MYKIEVAVNSFTGSRKQGKRVTGKDLKNLRGATRSAGRQKFQYFKNF